MKVGLLSGTFDPVHSGHITIAFVALDSLSLDQIWLLPEEQPRNKQEVTPYVHRVAMLKIVAQDSPNLEVIEVENAAHSVDTLREFKIQTPNDFFILVGGDVADDLDSWDDIDEIKQLATIVTVGRNDQKADITLKHPASSKVIRTQISSGKQPADIDPRVLSYIHEHKLYQEPAT